MSLGPLIDASLRGMLLALLLLLAFVLLRGRRRWPAAWPGAVLALGLCVPVAGAAPVLQGGAWQPLVLAVATANAVLFWVFVQALFDDAFTPKQRHWGCWLLVAVLAGCVCLLGVHPAAAGRWLPALAVLQQGLPLLFVLLAARAALLNWRADLVEARRRLRGFVLVAGACYTLADLAIRLAAPPGPLSGTAAALDLSLLLVVVLGAAAQLLTLGPWWDTAATEIAETGAALAPGDARPSAAIAQLPAADQALAEALQRLMLHDRAYLLEDLTVASLAQRLAVPEYRLRRLINRHWGHRNFNAFINAFRLEAAKAALADPTQRAQPILAIALGSGFQSIGPFNRAFKAALGVTPSEFRRQHMADS